jgi:2-keto-4-pentenoate hydratase
MQQQLGVDEPDFGALFADMVVEEGDPIPVSELIAPRIEAEIAFVMETDLQGPGVSSADALRAVAGALPALEIIDSRVADWKIKLPDTIADNASSARVVCGGRLTPIGELDLRTIGMVLTVDGAVAATGAGAAVLGNPIRCVAWLANKLGEFGVPLRAGDLVLAGALHAAVAVAAGVSVQAEFAELGSVTTRFGE